MHILYRCNDTRGWFPSNYVKVIDEDVGGGSSNRRHSQQSDILEPQPPQPRDFVSFFFLSDYQSSN